MSSIIIDPEYHEWQLLKAANPHKRYVFAIPLAGIADPKVADKFVEALSLDRIRLVDLLPTVVEQGKPPQFYKVYLLTPKGIQRHEMLKIKFAALDAALAQGKRTTQ